MPLHDDAMVLAFSRREMMFRGDDSSSHTHFLGLAFDGQLQRFEKEEDDDARADRWRFSPQSITFNYRAFSAHDYAAQNALGDASIGF